MVWQDIVISTAVVFFMIALIPSLTSKDKPAFKTSISTGILTIIIALTQGSMGLWITATITSINGFLWLILAYQKATARKR